MWLIVILILVGIVLLVAELILLPGISVAGIGAFIALLAAAFYGYMIYGILGGSLILTAIVLLSILAVIISLRANTWRRLTLNDTIDSVSTPTPQQQNIRIGEQGSTLTRLAPMGKVQFGQTVLEARSIDRYIDPKEAVEVIGFDNTIVIVKHLCKAPSTFDAQIHSGSL